MDITNMTLLQYIQEKNLETKAWLDANPGSFAGLWTEDLEYWHFCNVFTPEDFDKYILKSSIWDGFKELHGVRPRHLNLDEMTKEELERELEDLRKEFKYYER